MAVTSGYNWHFCGRGIITACSKKILSTFDKRKRYEINEIKWFNCGASLNRIQNSFIILYRLSSFAYVERNEKPSLDDGRLRTRRGKRQSLIKFQSS